MLYDPKWRRECVADLVAWLETQPSGESYNYWNCNRCLVMEWMGGRTDIDSWPDEIRQIYNGRDPWHIAAGARRAASEWTYGAALARARAHMAGAE